MERDIQKLTQRYGQLLEQHQCSVNESNYATFAMKLNSAQRLTGIENGMYSICDFNRKSFLHVSPKFTGLLGYNHAIEWGIGKQNSTYSLIHHDDLAFVLETEIMVYDYLHDMLPDEKQQYKLVYDFRIKNARSGYLRFIHRMVPLEFDLNGNTWLVMVASDLLSYQAVDETPRRYLINLQKDELCLFENDICPKSSQLLTIREKEILLLISQGLDSASISEKLFISICTVNNHRQNILRKTQTENTIQAAQFGKIIGCI